MLRNRLTAHLPVALALVAGVPSVASAACTGDVNRDGRINLLDLATLLSSLGLCSGQPQFAPTADLNADGCINLPDLATLLTLYGTVCTDVRAEFSGGVLTVTGDATDNVMRVGRDAAGNILVNGGAVTISGGPATVSGTTLIRLVGLAGNDEMRIDDAVGAMPGGEFVGGQGVDLMIGSAADDVFVWNPGDGSDTVEGEAGQDTLDFRGANIAETIDIAANGSRLRFTRDVGNIVMDCAGVEQVLFGALGGADRITVNDLAGTDVTDVQINLASQGGAGDGAADQVTVNATNSDDVIVVSGDASGVAVLGLAARVSIVGAEAANDRLTINALGGDDAVEASGLAASAIALTINGGDGNDVLIGGDGNDTITGGVGDDVLIGGLGQDVLDGGPGDNVVIQ